MKQAIIIFSTLFILLGQGLAQTKKITYTESYSDFANPERGFYIPTSTRASNYQLLDSGQMGLYRNQPSQRLKGASYDIKVSLIYRGIELDIFKDRELSESFLNNLQTDFDIIRKAGLKLILRFAYTNTSHSGSCGDEYKICPPYGDAPRTIVLRHIQQLKPLLQKNADVIAVLQEGFIGIWGENYFTDYFGDASTNASGVIEDTSWAHRNELLQALLDAMPKDRMVQVRTPQIKQRFVYGAHAPVNSAPLTYNEAWRAEYKSRIGFHNDCFLASPDDYGTFHDYGNSLHHRDTANKRLRTYFGADSRYVAVGGETCDDAFSPENDCAPIGHADMEMASMHYSYLNGAYNNKVNNDWDSLGCMKRIQLALGYRLVLKTAELPLAVKRGKTFSIIIALENKGYAAPFNPRPVELIMYNSEAKVVKKFSINANVQSWLPGRILLKQDFTLPADMSPGNYGLFLNLPDPYPALYNNPYYSIHIANENVWNWDSGFNSLQHSIKVH